MSKTLISRVHILLHLSLNTVRKHCLRIEGHSEATGITYLPSRESLVYVGTFAPQNPDYCRDKVALRAAEKGTRRGRERPANPDRTPSQSTASANDCSWATSAASGITALASRLSFPAEIKDFVNRDSLVTSKIVLPLVLKTVGNC